MPWRYTTCKAGCHIHLYNNTITLHCFLICVKFEEKWIFSFLPLAASKQTLTEFHMKSFLCLCSLPSLRFAVNKILSSHNDFQAQKNNGNFAKKNQRIVSKLSISQIHFSSVFPVWRDKGFFKSFRTFRIVKVRVKRYCLILPIEWILGIKPERLK